LILKVVSAMPAENLSGIRGARAALDGHQRLAAVEFLFVETRFSSETPKPVIAPKIPPIAVPAIAPPSAMVITPLAITGPTPGTSIAAAAPITAPNPAPLAMPVNAPRRSLAPSASVIMPPSTASEPRMAKPMSEPGKPAC